MAFAKRLAEFRFQNPEQWFCHVSLFMEGHSELHVKAQNTVSGELLTIVFVGTIYFEGPLQWRGAHFVLEPQEKCEALMHRLEEGSLKVTLEASKLFSSHISNAPDSNAKVSIIAGESAFVTDKNVSVPQ